MTKKKIWTMVIMFVIIFIWLTILTTQEFYENTPSVKPEVPKKSELPVIKIK